MNINKYMVLIVGLSIALIGCGSEVPEPSTINCSPSGMEKVLPHFNSEAERQAFIDGCNASGKEDTAVE